MILSEMDYSQFPDNLTESNQGKESYRQTGLSYFYEYRPENWQTIQPGFPLPLGGR